MLTGAKGLAGTLLQGRIGQRAVYESRSSLQRLYDDARTIHRNHDAPLLQQNVPLDLSGITYECDKSRAGGLSRQHSSTLDNPQTQCNMFGARRNVFK